MKNLLLTSLLAILLLPLNAQDSNKKMLDHADLVSWNRIQNSQISNDGNWVVYTLKAEEGDATLNIWNAKNGQTTSFDRAEGSDISADSRYVVFKIKAAQDSIKAMKRKKVKKDKMPKDTMAIYDLANGNLEKIANVKSFSLPDKWDGWLVYHKEVEKPVKDTTKAAIDTTQVVPDSTKIAAKKKKKRKKAKKEGKKTGTKLAIRNLGNSEETIVEFVLGYRLAEEGSRILINSTGKDSTFEAGIYLFDCASNDLKAIFKSEGKYKSLTFDETGTQAAFLANLDTTESRIPPFGMAYWKEGAETASIVADTNSTFLPTDWIVSENQSLSFSDDGSKLFLGIAPPPILKDTALLPEEIVNVEVWHWEDARIYPQQNNQKSREQRRTYSVVYNIENKHFTQLGSLEIPTIRRGDQGDSKIALGYTDAAYLKASSWEGSPTRKDLFIINVENGEKHQFATALRANVSLSPNTKYAYWYSNPDSVWYAYSVDNKTIVQLTERTEPFYDEINDRPMLPYSYGTAGWLKDDKYVLLYDRYDIWKVDPTGKEKSVNLTQGRSSKTVYRYVRLDREERFIEPNARLMLHVFDEKTKASGYGFLHVDAGKPLTILKEDYSYSSRPTKARDADKLMFTKQSFTQYPDLRYSDFGFQNVKVVSHANPQQSDYSWGSIEMYEWTSLSGEKLQGLLVKPEGFDPSKQYPMIVNFYERSSNGLHRHRTPLPGRSSVNYSFYASRGYIMFNPDVPYKIGYPGESAYDAVLSGVTSLIDEGFIDRERIGVQGHSWGGYQVAHLIAKTDIFRCAESGAPVVNMFSAYGGIRWGSGMSRMFQYEHTQSRIGGTIWEYPLRYLENSPLFFLDKVNTPVLILHNDEDGAVPWYQGIEYFVGLRRLGKPAWMLNYNGEPHWPVKLQNRKDFNIRMAQFFDYYLKDHPMPKWMEKGVPATEKGINQGLELMQKE